jgi:uncharacterized membrane protein YdjX (TVP38/TMEM64 family)
MQRVLPYALIVLVVALFGVGYALRGQLDLEVSVEAIRLFVDELGWIAPPIYVGLVTFRTFLFLPSWAVLIAGGLCFGVGVGALLGGLGLIVSALYQFAVARSIGQEWVRPRMTPRVRELERRVQRLGAVVVGLCTAHPVGPLTPVHVAAGLSSMALFSFGIAVVIAAPARSFVLALFGESLLDPGSPRFLAATGVLVAVSVIPLAHPWVRRQLLVAVRDPESSTNEEGT